MSKVNKELRLASLLLRPILAYAFNFRLAAFLMKLLRGKNIKGVHCEQHWIAPSDNEKRIRTRIYRPINASGKLPVLLYLHGGGYALGVPEVASARIKAFIDTRPCIVVAPDYRKSLEAPYPAALLDAYDMLLWVKNNIDELGGRSDQIMVGGHSAGGGLTAALCLYARDKGEVNISFQMPIYPMIDDRQQLPSAVDNHAAAWDSEANKRAWKLYLAGLEASGDEIPAYAAPSRATDLSNLPPAVTFVGDIEPFRDETIAFVEKLQQHNVAVDFKLFPGCFHAFETVVPKAVISKEADKFLLDAFAYAVEHYFAEQDL